MEICLICIGKTKMDFVAAGIREFEKRLRHYINFSIVEIPDIKTSKTLSFAEQKEKEGRKILEKIGPNDFTVLLDERGKEFTSKEFSRQLEKLMSSGRKRIFFVIGGPYGFSEEVYSKADSMLSLSKMTFNHEMVRMFFIEQLYRGMTILRGEPYHHD